MAFLRATIPIGRKACWPVVLGDKVVARLSPWGIRPHPDQTASPAQPACWVRCSVSTSPGKFPGPVSTSSHYLLLLITPAGSPRALDGARIVSHLVPNIPVYGGCFTGVRNEHNRPDSQGPSETISVRTSAELRLPSSDSRGTENRR